ncbi:hypothetical protein RIF29_26516 [Crotalaria pallida]|uniref:MADS-box domain-containing protein n=1 Tax=Crotalaria pallida TaxID=3830 RepID=A0AAN9ENS7_CROPI
MEKKSVRVVTFSKRKSGLFKKAMELSILCEVAVALVLFSVGGKSYSFGHPCIEAMIDQFPHQGLESRRGSNKPSKDDEIDKLSRQLHDLEDQLQVEKNKSEILDNGLNQIKLKESKSFVDCLNLEELKKFKASLEALTADLKLSMSEMEAASSLLLIKEKAV